MRRALLVMCLITMSAQARAQERDGVALLPLKSRGLQPQEQKRVEQRVVAGWKSERADVVEPDALLARLTRDERRRAALAEARKLRAEGVERYLGLDRAGARERFDRALALYRDNFGEYVDASGYAETHLWRGAERLASGDEPAARADFTAAAAIAPNEAPTLERFPPPVVEAWQQAASTRRSLASDTPAELAALAGALGVGTIAIARAERGEEGVVLEVLAWTSVNTPPRSARVVLPAQLGDIEKAAGAAASVARPTLSISRSNAEIPPRDITRPPVRRPVRPRRRNNTPWIAAGVGVLAVGAAAVYFENDRRQGGGPDDPYGVIIVPP